MLLHNQTPHRLRWEMGGEVYGCDPWGAVEVPDRLVGICKRRTLPLGPTPVAAENRAAAKARAAQDAARNDETFKLRSAVDAHAADAQAAKQEAEEVKGRLGGLREKLAAAQAEVGRLRTELTAAHDEKAAVEKQLEELAHKVAEYERRSQQKHQRR